ncbi:MAG: PilZ domain-containing protein [Thermoanaerobaculia bacterium]
MAKYATKRKVERIPLTLPILGRAGNLDVVILDISLNGCLLEHNAPLRVGSELVLGFEWNGREVTFRTTVVRCSLGAYGTTDDSMTVYHSGLLFLEGIDGSSVVLRQVIASQVTKALEEQKANARGELPSFLQIIADLTLEGIQPMTPELRDEYERRTSVRYYQLARGRGYVNYSFDGNRWKRVRTKKPEQPDEGFTIWAFEDSGEVERLQRAYERGDDVLKKLIRICAELSLAPADDEMPPQRFEP